MKVVTAIIKPVKLDEVRAALSELGMRGMTVSEVSGFGRQKGHVEYYRGAEFFIEFLPKVKLEIAVMADRLDEVVETIARAAKTGEIGDGKIFVTELEQAVRISTGGTDASALRVPDGHSSSFKGNHK